MVAIRNSIQAYLDTKVGDRKLGNFKYGVYAFYDYDGEPIYVGQTYETIRTRIRRHLTNQRTDAVAMNVLDPFEVAEIEIWPLIVAEGTSEKKAEALLNRLEYTVFQKVVRTSTFKAVLNEKDVEKARTVPLPPSYRQSIIPKELLEGRKHPDVRIARRASTMANLARVISERKVSTGLRRTLVTQARRLERLAKERYAQVARHPMATLED